MNDSIFDILISLFSLAIIGIIIKLLYDNFSNKKLNKATYKSNYQSAENGQANNEISIKANFPPYLHYEEDIELAKTIKGLKLLRSNYPKPFGPQFYYLVDNSITSENIDKFLNTLPLEFQFQFFKPFNFNKPSAGTNVSVQFKSEEYLCKNYSHGETDICYIITRAQLISTLLDCKIFQSENSFKAFRKSKEFELGK